MGSRIHSRQPGDILITKVTSHKTATADMSFFEQWCVWGNNLAEKQAKAAVPTDFPIFHQQLRSAYDKVLRNRTNTTQLYVIFADAADLAISAKCVMNDAVAPMSMFFSVDVPELAFPLQGSMREVVLRYEISDLTYVQVSLGACSKIQKVSGCVLSSAMLCLSCCCRTPFHF